MATPRPVQAVRGCGGSKEPRDLPPGTSASRKEPFSASIRVAPEARAARHTSAARHTATASTSSTVCHDVKPVTPSGNSVRSSGRGTAHRRRVAHREPVDHRRRARVGEFEECSCARARRGVAHEVSRFEAHTSSTAPMAVTESPSFSARVPFLTSVTRGSSVVAAQSPVSIEFYAPQTKNSGGLKTRIL